MRAKLCLSLASFVLALHAAIAAPVVYFKTTPPDVPAEVLVGGQFKFKVRFKQPNGASFGYGPFIDLALDMGGANVSKGIPPCVCDGITFVKAEMVDIAGGPIALTPFPATPISTTPCVTSPSNTTVPHPFPGILPLILPAGAQLITLELPFGSFAPPVGNFPAQPEIVVEVTVSVSNRADVGVPLRISARGGFRYGTTTPLDDPGTDPPVLSDENPPGTQVGDSTLWNAQAQVTPTVMILKKEYLGPEDETATGPNFPRQYKITANVATLPTANPLTNVVIKDCLPNNVVFTGLDLIQTVPLPVPIPPPQTTALNNNCISFNYPTVLGTSSSSEIVIVFNFYVPETDANGKPILDPVSCANAVSPNDVKAEWDWVPLDPCDWQGSTTPKSEHGTSDIVHVDHLLNDKHLAIQKKVQTYPVAGAPVIPGVKLQYTLDFQISDFFTFGGITVADTLADGQALLTNPPPQLIVHDRRGGPTVVPLSNGLSLIDFPNPFAICGGVNGGWALIFQVSTAMINNPGLFSNAVLKQGILTGGHAFTPFSPVPATGKIVFYAQVQDTFAFPHPGDKYVDKDDPINNCVRVIGDIYSNDAVSPKVLTPLARCEDPSETHLTIATDTIKKTVYAVKRGGSFICGPSGPACVVPPAVQDVHPGDQVTFRIQKRIASSDAEHLTIQDWLPLPKFDVNDPDANGPGGLTFPNGAIGTCPSAQLPGQACKLLPGHTLPVTPTFLPAAGTNSIIFDYGTFNAVNNLFKNIDLLFTANVTNVPAADGLFLTNEAQECEKNTFDITFCQAAVAQVKVREPQLVIKKGVVATNNPNGTFNPGLTPGGKWKPFGTSCPRFNAPITHANLPGLINSNLSNVDANDRVTFAIAIENTGGAPAYDIQLDDIFPCDPLDKPACFSPDYSTLCVRRGDGSPVAFTTAIGGHCRTKINLSPGFSLPQINTTGANILIITFNAQLNPDVQPGCCDNRTDLLHYSSKAGGPDFVGAGLTPPFSDSATVCVNPTLTKSLVSTSEIHTTGSNLTIGEIARFRLLITLPETGLLTNFQVTDALPPGLKFLNDNSARIAFVSNGAGIARAASLSSLFNSTTIPSSPTLHLMPPIPPNVIFPIPVNCGDPVIFNLGPVQNNDNDFDPEYIVIEFNALVCNVTGNVSGTQLSNSFSLSVGGNQIAASNSVTIAVTEPKLTIAKVASPATVAQGGTITYTVTINAGPIQAFDVQFADTLPAGLTFSTGSTTVTGGCSSTSSSSPALTCSNVPANATVTITYKAVANPATCPATLANQATVTWTSLPGPKGTTANPTWSTTPGNSGDPDGERDGVTAPPTLNDYSASAGASVAVTCPPCTQPPPGMVSWWPGDGNPKDIQDGNHGTLKNNATFAPGKVDSAFIFDGIGAYVEVPDSPSLAIATGHTVDLWVKVDAYPPKGKYSVLVNKWVDGAEDKYLGIDSTGKVFYYLYSPFGAPLASSKVLALNTWYHIAGTYDGTTAKIYINGGSPDASRAATGDVNDSTGKLFFGHNPGRAAKGEPFTPFKGQLDEIEWFNSALTESDIERIYLAGPSGKCKCLAVSNETIDCNPDGTFTYTFTFTNLSSSNASTVNFSPVGNITITPSSIPLSPPLPPGGSKTITVTIGDPGATSGASVCFFAGLTGLPGSSAVNCRVQHCITLPKCSTACCAPPPGHMVSWWPLNDHNGDKLVIDIKGGQHGTPNGSATVSGSVPGKVGGAFLFSPSVNVPDAPPLRLGTSNLSIDAWVTVPSQFVVGITDKLDTVTKKGYAFYIESGTLKFVIGNGSALSTNTSTVTVPASTTAAPWHHVAVTVDRTSKVGTFYIDGAVAGSPFTLAVANTVDISSSVPLILGGSRLPFPNCVCEFQLDEIEIFDDLVSPAAIKAIFDAGSLGKCLN